MSNNKKEDIINKAWIVQEFLEQEAEKIDKDNIFPHKGIKALKDNNFMSLLIPEKIGGLGLDIKTTSEVAQILASGCLSTSIIWGMHCQQVMTIINHTQSKLKEKILSEIVKKQYYIASVTSEYGKGGHLLTSNSPLSWITEDTFFVNKEAPTVTGGTYADAYLITTKRDESSIDSDVSLIYGIKENFEIIKKNDWESMGMRGTQSIAMTIKGTLNKDNIITQDKFENVCQYTLIPMAHIMWVSSWLGAVKKIFKQQVKLIRRNKLTKKYNSDIIIYRLSHVRLLIDTVEVYLEKLIDTYENCYQNKELAKLKSNNFNIHLNNLKILGSDNLFKAVNELIEIAGMYHGYLKNQEISLERTFRDLRSASLMYHNDRLKIANGKLLLFDSDLLPKNKKL